MYIISFNIHKQNWRVKKFPFIRVICNVNQVFLTLNLYSYFIIIFFDGNTIGAYYLASFSSSRETIS